MKRTKRTYNKIQSLNIDSQLKEFLLSEEDKGFVTYLKLRKSYWNSRGRRRTKANTIDTYITNYVKWKNDRALSQSVLSGEIEEDPKNIALLVLMMCCSSLQTPFLLQNDDLFLSDYKRKKK